MSAATIASFMVSMVAALVASSCFAWWACPFRSAAMMQ